MRNRQATAAVSDSDTSSHVKKNVAQYFISTLGVLASSERAAGAVTISGKLNIYNNNNVKESRARRQGRERYNEI